MKRQPWIMIAVSCVLFWATMEVLAQRGGGRGGGGRGGGGGRAGGAGARPAGGGGRPGGMGGRPGGMPSRPGGAGGGVNRTPSFSQPRAGNRPAQLPSNRPSVAGRPSQLPSGRPGVGGGPGIGGGVGQRPGGGVRPGAGDRPPIASNLPANRPGIGSRPGVGGPGGIGGPGGVAGRPGIGGVGGPGGVSGRPPIASNLPSTRPDIGGRNGIGRGPGFGVGAGIGAGVGAGIGAGLANRVGDRPGTLPGLGDQRPGIGNRLSGDRNPQERRQALQERLTGEGRFDQLPARDWNQVRDDWQQHRDTVRDDWQSYRDQAREDWQNWSDDHYPYYGGWYWGHAPGYWGRWDYLWDQYPVAAAAGLTWWGANNVGYQFGYADYSNPYYAETMTVNYSEPVITMPLEVTVPVAAAESAPASLPPGISRAGITKFDQARTAFLEGRYSDALKLTDEAVAEMPRDAVLHEFRSLVLFALKRYPESAAAIHAVLAVGPGWDWKTLSSLYPDVDTYTAQLRALETACEKDPKSADVRFLLGYHYLTCGHTDAALAQFRRAAELLPKDTVSASLVATLSPRDAQPAQTPAGAAPKAVPAAEVAGTWTANGRGSAKYAMNLKKDGTFTWSYTHGSRKQEAKGVYTVQGNVLAMEPDSGGVLLAELTVKEPDAMNFKMIGGAADDPGLGFRRAGPG